MLHAHSDPVALSSIPPPQVPTTHERELDVIGPKADDVRRAVAILAMIAGSVRVTPIESNDPRMTKRAYGRAVKSAVKLFQAEHWDVGVTPLANVSEYEIIAII